MCDVSAVSIVLIEGPEWSNIMHTHAHTRKHLIGQCRHSNWTRLIVSMGTRETRSSCEEKMICFCLQRQCCVVLSNHTEAIRHVLAW